MKLMTCAECAQSINANRETCPFCGTPTATSADIADRLYRGRTLEVRVGAADALGDMATPGAVRLLTTALTNKYRYSPDLSHCIAHELARIGEPAVPATEALLGDRVAGPYAREALDMIRPEAATDTPFGSGVDGTAAAAVPDRVGQSLVKMKSSADVRLGLIGGGAVVGFTWLGTFLLGLIPVNVLGAALLAPSSEAGDPFDGSWWAVWSLLGHFGGTVRIAISPSASIEEFGQGSYSFNLTSLVPLAIYVGVMVLVGIYVRRTAHASIRARLVTLLVTATIVALAVAAAAVLGGRSMEGSQPPGDVAAFSLAFDAFSFLLRSFVMTMLVGFFAFGIVGLLAAPHAVALRGAASYAAVPVLVVALMLPIVLGFYGDPAVPGERTSFIGLGTLVSPAAGSVMVPMAFGAQATAGVERADLDQVANYIGGDTTGANLTRYLRSYSAGRIFWYAGFEGTAGRVGAFVLVIALLAIWVDTVRRYLRVMGAPTGILGLEAGAYVGLLTGLAVILLAMLLTIHVDLSGYDAANSASVSLTAGLTVPALIYVLFIVTASGALIGYLLGTFWPSPVRHTLYDFANLTRHLGEGTPTPLASPDSSVVTAAQVTQSVTPPAPLVPESIPPVAAPPTPPARALPPEVPPSAAGQVAPVAQPTPARQVTPAIADAAPSSPDPVERLQKLADLRDAGILTSKEFDAAKQKILDSL